MKVINKILISKIFIRGTIYIALAAVAIVLGVNGFADNVVTGTPTEYMAPELVLEFAQEDVNWKQGIEYDSDKYILDVVDNEEAISSLYNGPGTTKVEYRLRLLDESERIRYGLQQETLDEFIQQLSDFSEHDDVVELIQLYRDYEAGEDISTTTDSTLANTDNVESGNDGQGDSQRPEDQLEESQVEGDDTLELGDASEQEQLEEEVLGNEATVEGENEVETKVTSLLEGFSGQSLVERFKGVTSVAQLLENTVYYNQYISLLDYKEELALEDSRINEVGSIYFYRDVTVTEPCEYEDLYITIGQEYDLMDGITYDEDTYTVTLENEETFNGDAPGMYLLIYTAENEVGHDCDFVRRVFVDYDADANEGAIETPIEDTQSDEVSTMSLVPGFTTDESTGLRSSTISKSGSYEMNISNSNYSDAYVYISGHHVTLYLSGSGTIGGLELSSVVRTLVIWVESGSVINFKAPSSRTGYAAIHGGGSNNQVFILGEGKLNIIGANAGNGEDGVVGVGSASGGAAATPGICNIKTASIYSTGSNITITGGNGGAGGTGGNSSTYATFSTTGSYTIKSGGGGGGGGYPAPGVGYKPLSGGDGGTGASNGAGYYFYLDSTVKGGSGGHGSLGGGGGRGGNAYRSATSAVTIVSVVESTNGKTTYYAGGGASGSINSDASVTDGYTGSTGATYTNSANSTLSAGTGGTGGLSYGINRIMSYNPVYLHYNGDSLANPIGSPGGLYNTTSSKYKPQGALGTAFYGFVGYDTTAENALTNVVDVVGSTTHSSAGVSYTPAPPMDLAYYFTDPQGKTSGVQWSDPDIAGRNTGYNIPDGYEIVGYNVSYYTSSTSTLSPIETTYYSVSEVATSTPGKLKLPVEDVVTGAYFWGVNLVIEPIGGGDSLTSPTAAVNYESPYIAVYREDESGLSFMTLADALDYINEDTLNPTGDDGYSTYRLQYLVDYTHNVGMLSVNVIDPDALQSFAKPNTHLIFESEFTSTSGTEHTDRFMLTATSFALPEADVNIKVTLQDINVNITTMITYGCDVNITDEMTGKVSTIRAVASGDTGITSSAGKEIYLEGAYSTTNIYLDNGIYAPSIFIGKEVEDGEEPLALSYSLTNLTGAAYVGVREGVTISISNSWYMPAYNNPLDTDRNGHFVMEGDVSLKVAGGSTTNEVGNLVSLESGNRLTFTSGFPGDEHDEAPLTITQETQIAEDIGIEFGEAYLYDDSWIGHDVIAFSSIDKIDLSKFSSRTINLGIDRNTVAIEIIGQPEARVRVSYDDEYKEFATYEAAVEYLADNYKSTVTMTLIRDYDCLGDGGVGLDAYDNQALKAMRTYVYTLDAEINPDTGERYTFVDNGDGRGYNNVLALPEIKYTSTSYFYLQDMHFSFIDTIYQGDIYLRLNGNITFDGNVTFIGTYDLSNEAGESTIAVTNYSVITDGGTGEECGIELVGYYKIYVNGGSTLHVSGISGGENYKSCLQQYSSGKVVLEKGVIYELDYTMSTNGTGTIQYNHRDAIIQLEHDQSISSMSNYIRFGSPEIAGDKVLMICNLKGEPSITEASRIYNGLTMSTEYSHVSNIVREEHIIKTESPIMVEAVETGEISYYSSIRYAIQGTSTDYGHTSNRGIEQTDADGQFIIHYISDYAMEYVDTNAVYEYNSDRTRDNTSLKFTSMKQEVRNNPEEYEDSDDNYYSISMYNTGSSIPFGRVFRLPRHGAITVEFDEIYFGDTSDTYILGAGAGIIMGEDVRKVATSDMDIVGVAFTSYYHSGSYRKDADSVITIKGGDYRYVSGGTHGSYAFITEDGVCEVNIEGGTIEQVFGGRVTLSTALTETSKYAMNSTVNISGGTITVGVHGSQCGYGNAVTGSYGKINIYGEHTIPYIYNFDEVNVHEDSVLTLTYRMSKRSVFLGMVNLYENSQLILDNPDVNYSNTMGNLSTKGEGASLVLTKKTSAVPVTFDIAGDGVDVSEGGVLTILPHPNEEYEEFVIGDTLFQFATPSKALEVSSFNNGFDYGLHATAGTSVGTIKLGSRAIAMSANGGEWVTYSTIESAFQSLTLVDEEVKANTDYTILIKEADYTMSTADATAMKGQTGLIKSATFTSTYILGEGDILGEGESVGDIVKRKVMMSQGSSWILQSDTYIEKIALECTSAVSIYANGYPLRVGTGKAPFLPDSDVISGVNVEMVGSYFPTIYGAYSAANDLDSIHLELTQGTYAGVYGVYNSNVSGDVYVSVGDENNDYIFTTVNGNIRSAGGSSTVSGDVNMLVYNTTIGIDGTSSSYIDGGCYSSTASIAGGSTLTLGNVYPLCTSLYVSGTYYGGVSGNVSVSVEKNGIISEKNIDIYGIYNGTTLIGGDVFLNLSAGGSYRYLSAGNCSGKSYIHIGMPESEVVPVSINYVRYFDALYVGYNENIELPDVEGINLNNPTTANVTVNTSMTTSSGRDNNVYLLEESSLYLPTSSSCTVNNLFVDDTYPSLYIGKQYKTSTSRSLTISQDHLSVMEDGSKTLVLGLHPLDLAGLTMTDFATNGDDLLKFTNTENRNPDNYISAVENYDVVESSVDGVLELGPATVPHVNLEEVEHKNSEGDITAPHIGTESITKTLNFTIHNYNEEGEFNGFDIMSAYISDTSVSNTTWVRGGVIPTASLAEVELTVSDDGTFWYGTATMTVSSTTKYYLHVRDERSAVKVSWLDLQSPTYSSTPSIEVSGGNKNISITLTEPTYSVVTGTDKVSHTYTPSGIAQMAWSIGTLTEAPAREEVLDSKVMTNSSNLHGVHTDSTLASYYVWDLSIDDEYLEDVDIETAVLYLYIKDSVGNTKEIQLPLSEYGIDVSIPSRIGILAYRDFDNYLLSPKCYVVNNGSTTVQAEVVGSNIQENNEINFVTGRDNLGANSMWLVMSSDGRPEGYSEFEHISIEYLHMRNITLGTMTPASGTLPAAYFTFVAEYNKGDLDLTSSWSLFSLDYKFTLVK